MSWRPTYLIFVMRGLWWHDSFLILACDELTVWRVNCISCQSINLISMLPICHKRIRSIWWQRLGRVFSVHCMHCHCHAVRSLCVWMSWQAEPNDSQMIVSSRLKEHWRWRRVTMRTENCKNGGVTLSRTNFSVYAGHSTIFSWMLTTACCLVVWLGL